MSKQPSNVRPPKRNDHGRKRWLTIDPSPQTLAERFRGIRYICYGKHKSNPYLYGAQPYRGADSDRSLCDEHAEFGVPDMERIPRLFDRAKAAGLIGNLIWTVDDSGWIYELQLSNAQQKEWHGYPMLPDDPFARQVGARFVAWAGERGSDADRLAAYKCEMLYGLRP